MDLKTGKVYVEETFSTVVNGEHIVGLKLIEDDKLWGRLIFFCEKYKLTNMEHIAACLSACNAKLDRKILSLITSNTNDIKILENYGVLK